ncbi:MAG: Glu-tRNA(Gln) amidotransferase subunit GatE [Acidobacteria bacterium]|nr:Glu-tRNA(Gln) amidotransferase subunit GatE [Acidobacteriota bacterium]
MKEKFDPQKNVLRTMKQIGFVPRKAAKPQVYQRLGFRSGLEIHQQLLTDQKLFCRCPAGLYQEEGQYDAELIRHMRPTLSELGEYDGTALMEFKTRKNIIYRIKNETACTYDIDDTPPFPLNRQALDIALEISLLLQTSIVGELHITRKQYLDGSIPTGFQRTAIVGIDGEIPLGRKKIRIAQLSLEEDSCREVSDVGHWRVYTTDRLGMPLVETVTYPDMKTPDEVAETAHYLRFLARSTGKVRTGMGAARQDVNVSISGGTRVEIKGVAHIRWIPELTHVEAFRQKALLHIRTVLRERVRDVAAWSTATREINSTELPPERIPLPRPERRKVRVAAVNLPEFRGLLSCFTQPGQVFADEISHRLKVIACLEKPNMASSEDPVSQLTEADWNVIRDVLGAGPRDAQVVIWASPEDMPTALETVTERCRLAFDGVPNETRQALPDGTTCFERVLPGPDRMYPDTDSAPIPITGQMIRDIEARLPSSVASRIRQFERWGIPADTHSYLLRNNLFLLIQRIIDDFDTNPVFVGSVLGHTLKHIEGALPSAGGFTYEKVHDLFSFVHQRGLEREIIRRMLPEVYQHPKMDFESVLITIDYREAAEEEILSHVPVLMQKFNEINTSDDELAVSRWMMGKLRGLALGNMPLAGLWRKVEEMRHAGSV